MRTVTAREANQSFSKLLAQVEAGETVVVTKHGKPVAELRPKPRDKRDDPEWQAAHASVLALLQEARKLAVPNFRYEPMSEDEIYGDRLRWPK